jgi:hypothetical protein
MIEAMPLRRRRGYDMVDAAMLAVILTMVGAFPILALVLSLAGCSSPEG